MSSEMRELVRKAEALAVCVMAVDSYSRDELRVFAENFRDEARTLLARTEAGADGAVGYTLPLPDGTLSEMMTTFTSNLIFPLGQRVNLFTHPQDASGDAENSRRYLKLKELFRARFHRSTSDYWVIEGECKTDPRFFGEDAEQLTLDAALDAMQAKEAK